MADKEESKSPDPATWQAVVSRCAADSKVRRDFLVGLAMVLVFGLIVVVVLVSGLGPSIVNLFRK